MPENELQATLQHCSLHSVLMLTSKVLTRSGYGDVQILDRRQGHQKTRFGGYELLCETTVGTVPMRIAVKVILDDIRVRMVDELAGAVLRTNANHGLIVSPFRVTRTARKHLESYCNVRIDVIDGGVFAALLSKYQIGVRSRGGVDYTFFAELEDVSERLLAFIRENRT